jgi:hypothetical protein
MLNVVVLSVTFYLLLSVVAPLGCSTQALPTLILAYLPMTNKLERLLVASPDNPVLFKLKYIRMRHSGFTKTNIRLGC